MESMFLLLPASSSSIHPNSTSRTRLDAMGEMLCDAFTTHQVIQEDFNMHQVVQEDLESNKGELNDLNDEGKTQIWVGDEQPSTEVAKLYKLLEDMNEKLNEGSKRSRLYSCIHLFHLKCMRGMTRKGSTN